MKTTELVFAFSPNAFGQPTQIGSMATLGYDLAGRINSVTDAAGTHTQSYIDGQKAVESYTSGVLHGQSVTRGYDTLGRLIKVALPGGKSISYSYNASGSLASVATAGGASGTWSNFNPVTGNAGSFALGPHTAGIVYDGLGRLVSYATLAGGDVYGYTYSYDGVQPTGSILTFDTRQSAEIAGTARFDPFGDPGAGR